MLDVAGYRPRWHHDAEALAAAHRHRFARLIGRRLRAGWLLYDVTRRAWCTDGPVVLGFGATRVEITHRTFDECAITWNEIDLSVPVDHGYAPLAWRPDPDRALRNARGRPLRAVNVVELLTPADWRPRVLHAVELLFDDARLAVYNAMAENGLTDVPAAELPAYRYRRVHVA